MHTIPDRVVVIDSGLAGDRARVEDEDVEALERLGNLRDKRIQRVAVGEIATVAVEAPPERGHGCADLSSVGLERGGDSDDVRAGLRERECGCAPDPAPTAGDERSPA